MAETCTPRQVLKAAQRIHDVLVQPVGDGVPLLAGDGWIELQRLAGRLQIAIARGWSVAVGTLRDDARHGVRRLERHLNDWLAGIPHERVGSPAASVREIHADLLALRNEFEEFGIDLKEGTLSAVTEPITLEGVELGRFEIVVRWDDLDVDRPYEVVALDRNAAGLDSTTTHPHVRDDRLCEGEGHSAIGAALRSGRLFDFFVLVRQILQSYNAASAYVPLDQWNGHECRDCGQRVSDDEATCCERCDRSICFECSSTCCACRRDCCDNCRGLCAACDSSVCDRCAEWCSACSERLCSECIHDGTCPSCRETENETDETVPESTTTSTPGTPPAETTLQPDGVGQAPVPA